MNKNIGVVGAGFMGGSIALVSAKAGYKVIVVDQNQEIIEDAKKRAMNHLNKQYRKNRINKGEIGEIFNNITYTENLQELQDEAIIIEAVSENLKVKQNIFQQLDEYSKKETILATNTSSLSINEIAQVTKNPDRVIGTHFFSPATVMKLVEITPGINTDQKVVNQSYNFIKSIGKNPVLAVDYPGFIVNRILTPVMNEGMYLLMEGLDKKDIDEAMKLGANHPMGPLELADFCGLDIVLATMESLYEGFGDSKYRPCPILKNMVRAGNLGRKTGKGFYDYN